MEEDDEARGLKQLRKLALHALERFVPGLFVWHLRIVATPDGIRDDLKGGVGSYDRRRVHAPRH